MKSKWLRPVCWVRGHRDFKVIDELDMSAAKIIFGVSRIKSYHFECMRCIHSEAKAVKSMTLRMDDETAAQLDERIGLVAREKWVRELVKAELAHPVHMPAGKNGGEDDG